MSDSSCMSDSSMSDGSSREPRTTKQFERAIRNRTYSRVGTEDGHHFRHKVPVFVATKAMEEYRASGATGEQVCEMQEQLITMMSDPTVGSMDPEDDNKLDSMYESVYRGVYRQSTDKATTNAAFDDIYNDPTPSQKRLIDTYNIQSAEELRDLARDHVQEGLDTLRSMSRNRKFASEAIDLVCAQYDKPYLRHFMPTHQGGTPNRDRILGRTLEERHLDLDMRRLSIVEAKIADRNHLSRRLADDDLALAIELSTVQVSITSRRRAPPRSNPADNNRLIRQQEEGDARRAARILQQQEQEKTNAEMAATIHRQDLAAERLRVQHLEAQRQAQQQKREAEQREERRAQQHLEAQRQQQKREAEQREERRLQQHLEAQRQQQKREAEQREERRVQQLLEAQRQAQQQYVYLQVSHTSNNSYTPQRYISGRSSSPPISHSSYYSSSHVQIHSVSPPGSRARSEWDVFRTEHRGLGWTQAEMSENYRNRNN